LPAISLALELLDDHHSYYTSNTGLGSLFNPSIPKCSALPFQSKPVVPTTVGYVYAGACLIPGCDPATYAAQLQAQVRSADNSASVDSSNPAITRQVKPRNFRGTET
jgi:hypothetical protein